MSLLSANCLMTLYICTKFQQNISKGFRVIEQTHTEIYKGAKFHKKNVGGVTVLVLCTSPDNALYLSQVSTKHRILMLWMPFAHR